LFLEPRLVNPTAKYGGGSFMLWDCMTAYGVGYLCRMDQGMDAELYTEISSDELKNTMEYYGYDQSRVMFQ
jgi:hypothetical protein